MPVMYDLRFAVSTHRADAVAHAAFDRPAPPLAIVPPKTSPGDRRSGAAVAEPCASPQAPSAAGHRHPQPSRPSRRAAMPQQPVEPARAAAGPAPSRAAIDPRPDAAAIRCPAALRDRRRSRREPNQPLRSAAAKTHRRTSRPSPNRKAAAARASASDTARQPPRRRNRTALRASAVARPAIRSPDGTASDADPERIADASRHAWQKRAPAR